MTPRIRNAVAGALLLLGYTWNPAFALHGMGAPPDIMCNATTIDLAEEGRYILAAPMGYNTTGWYGSPVIGVRGRRGGGGEDAPDNLA